MGYARGQVTDFDTQGTQAAERLWAMSLSGLLVAVLVVGHPFGRFLIKSPAGRGRQAPGRQVAVGRLPHLFDRQVQGVGRFFL